MLIVMWGISRQFYFVAKHHTHLTSGTFSIFPHKLFLVSVTKPDFYINNKNILILIYFWIIYGKFNFIDLYDMNFLWKLAANSNDSYRMIATPYMTA